MRAAFILALLLPLAHLPRSHAAACATARYKLTLTTLFATSNFPAAPPSAHLSPLTAFSHAPRFSSFVLYGYATRGVQDVAETGDNSRLLRELRHPLVLSVARTRGLIFAAGDSFEVELDVDCEHPLVSAISMIAPSPDWFVALSRVDLRRRKGDRRFVKRRTGVLRVYDAGTDAGETLSARDRVSDPVQNIAPLMGAPFDGKPAATYKLERIATGSK